MKRFYLIISALSVLWACVRENAAPTYRELIDLSDSLMVAQEYDQATQTILKALEIAEQEGSPAHQSQALSYLAHIDLVTWRDSQAWEHACEAERLSRQSGVDSLVCLALLQKGKVCACAGITQEDARDQEALGYLQEALELSEGTVKYRIEILQQLSQVYVNLNRFKDKIDQDVYRQAGVFLDTADSIARAAGRQDLLNKSLSYRMRYYRQGRQVKKGIESCENILAGCGEKDYLTQSQAWNMLTMLRAQEGNVEGMANAHQQYVYTMEHYMKQKADDKLQEMESRYGSALKEIRIRNLKSQRTILAVALVLLLAMIAVVLNLNRKLKNESRTKEQLLGFISKDLTNPEFNQQVSSTLRELSRLDDDGIRARCKELFASAGNVSEEVFDHVVDLIHERQKFQKKFALSKRELEILHLCGEGLTSSQIAERLAISVHTVNNHKQNIYSKMGVGNNAEMLHAASEAGL